MYSRHSTSGASTYSDRMGYDLQHQQRIVGLFAFERPGIEGLQHRFGGNFPLVARRI
jgi:hypothetical protein